MAKFIPLYPVLTDDRKNQIRYMVIEDYQFYYNNNGEEHSIEAEETSEGSGVYTLIDQLGEWDPDVNNICFKRTFQLNNTDCLFGEHGIVCTNAAIGVAVIWKSADSKQRGAIEIGTIRYTDRRKEFRLVYDQFDKAQLRGIIELSTILFIKNAGTPRPNERHLANTYGCILGELDRISVILDGDGSIFPVYEIYDPDQPLWYVKCNWDDPDVDQFSDCVSVVINRAHKNYRYLDRQKKTFDEQLMIEIMSTALIIIIMKLKDNFEAWSSVTQGVNLQQGSVSQAVRYFIDVLGLDANSMESLLISIHQYFDQRMSYANK